MFSAVSQYLEEREVNHQLLKMNKLNHQMRQDQEDDLRNLCLQWVERNGLDYHMLQDQSKQFFLRQMFRTIL